MQHLSRFGMSHNKLDSSRVLFSPDGCVKIGAFPAITVPTPGLMNDAQAHFDECRTTESAAARSLGVVAIEMMQNGIPPEEDGKFVLKHPDRWSLEASNFLEVSCWGTLNEVRKVRGSLATLAPLINNVLASLSNACIANCYDSVYSLCRLGYY